MPDDSNTDECSIAATLDVIGDRWTLLILRDLFRGVRRFSELVDDLGIAKNLLSDRLKRLVEHGIVDKVPYQERPVRYEYRLTHKGAELSPALIALMRWGDDWYAGGRPPVVLVHDACETALVQHTWCPTCGVGVTPGHVRSRAQSNRSSQEERTPS
jgi:DNA-binding HxlR family transcriptional regulator